MKKSKKTFLLIWIYISSYSVGVNGIKSSQVDRIHKWTSIEAIAQLGKPALLVGGAKKWNEVVGKSTRELISNHFAKEDMFYFDVAPENRTSSESFTFIPYYKDHGYVFDSDICSIFEKQGRDLLDRNNEAYQMRQSCRGSNHSHSLKSLHQLLTKSQDIMFAKLSPNNIPPSLANKLKPDEDFVLDASQERDFDLWIGTKGWTSATHYDLQDNCYIQLVGRKKFVVSPPFSTSDLSVAQPSAFGQTVQVHDKLQVTISDNSNTLESWSDLSGTTPSLNNFPESSFHTEKPDAVFIEPVGGGIFPHLHARHRQTFSTVNESSPGSLIGILEPGDVLFLPSFWLHTFTALSTSASLAMCSTSVAEQVAFELEHLPIPLEEDWSLETQGRVLFKYFDLITRKCFNMPIVEFTNILLTTRYKGMFTDDNGFHIIVDKILLSNNHKKSRNENNNEKDHVDDVRSNLDSIIKLLMDVHNKENESKKSTPFALSVNVSDFQCQKWKSINSKGGSTVADKQLEEEGKKEADSIVFLLADSFDNAALLEKLERRSSYIANELVSKVDNRAVRFLLIQNFLEQMMGFLYGGLGTFYLISNCLT